MTTRRALLAGAGGAGLAMNLAWLGSALAADKVARGVHRVSGEVSVNGKPATKGMRVRSGDSVATGPNGDVVFVVGRDAFMLRADSRVDLVARQNSSLLAGLRIVTGRILSVFAPGEAKLIQATTVSVGIRGTAVYIEAAPDKTYVCACYGTVELASRDDPSVQDDLLLANR